jgi:D-lyxose ketol-isomerase
MPAADGGIDREAEVVVPTDGVIRKLPAGGLLKLDPGESVTLLPGVWHAFWGEGGDVLIGEVSTVNDDLTDNIFADPIGRFSNIVDQFNIAAVGPSLRFLIFPKGRIKVVR